MLQRLMAKHAAHGAQRVRVQRHADKVAVQRAPRRWEFPQQPNRDIDAGERADRRRGHGKLWPESVVDRRLLVV